MSVRDVKQPWSGYLRWIVTAQTCTQTIKALKLAIILNPYVLSVIIQIFLEFESFEGEMIPIQQNTINTTYYFAFRSNYGQIICRF